MASYIDVILFFEYKAFAMFSDNVLADIPPVPTPLTDAFKLYYNEFFKS